MNRLQTELNRLYLSHDPQSECQDPAGAELSLFDAAGQVRAMVVEVAQQAGWDAIAVSGIDGYQVWFSPLEPVPVAQALDFLESLPMCLGASTPGRNRPLVGVRGPWPGWHVRK